MTELVRGAEKMLITIEGIDGSGKNTLAEALRAALSERHVVEMVSSPGYQRTETGRLIGRYLAGEYRLGNESPYALSLLFALDRQEGQPQLRQWLSQGRIVIADRYAASNVAYQAARASSVAESVAVREFVLDLEFEKLGTIVPSVNIWLDIPVSVSRELIANKGKRDYVQSTYDKFEADRALMERVSTQYRELCAGNAYGDWLHVETCDDRGLRQPGVILAEVLDRLAL
ncbi:dTMP kinase [Shinella sumterensis]|uniref:dTMP kinase n=1 Tax=Shinella sumterensis TaxID=1967501 RepID=UPI0014300EA5|nr:dTMP kinase [Shinella sumterensis]MCD1267030.1 dTMP kinase [Shinella sumterensis]